MGIHHSKSHKGTKIDYKAFHMTKKQYEALRKEWEQLVEGGRVSREKWISVAVSTGEFDEEMAGLSFDAFDLDGNHIIDVEEYFTVASLSFNGTLEDKIRASFHVFDRNHDGKLSKAELQLRMRILARNGENSNMLTAEQSEEIDKRVDAILDDVFELIDTDHSGDIDIEEYVKGFCGNPEVNRFIEELQH